MKGKMIGSDYSLSDTSAIFAGKFVGTIAKNMAGPGGLEPPTPGFGDRCSANWASGLYKTIYKSKFVSNLKRD